MTELVGELTLHHDEKLVEDCAALFTRIVTPAQPVFLIATHIDLKHEDCRWLFASEARLPELKERGIKVDMRTKRIVPPDEVARA